MNCEHCSTPLPTNSRFCLACGADLSDPGGGPRTTGASPNLMSRLSRTLEGRYRVTKMVGRGGMGAVFLAEDLTLERPVAIKVLPPEVSHDENLIGRFEREARTAAKLDHPNIIPIFSVEGAEDLHFFVMKYVSGESLDEVLKRGRVPIEQAQSHLWESARALGHAHQRGVVHRDIKPANIMLDHDGRVMLTDFGISKAMQAATQFTGTGQVVGTPHYMSPEQAKGTELDGRSDQYSLAVVGYQMVTGRLPFGDDSIHAVIYKHVSQDPTPIRTHNPNCPPFIATALHRALSKRPADRFSTMEEFAMAVCPDRRLSIPTNASTTPAAGRSSASEAPTEISAARAVEPATPGARRGILGVAAMLLAAALAGGYWTWAQGYLEGFGVGPSTLSNEVAAVPSAGAEGGAATLASILDTVSTLPDPLPEPDSVAESSAPGDSADVAPATEPPQPQPVPVQRPVTTRPQPPRRDPQPAPRVGLISLLVEPFGRVYIDDVVVGDSPIVEHELSVGRHVLRITRPGCQDMIDTVMVDLGRTTMRRIQFECGMIR